MADQSAGLFAPLFSSPGNPELPTLPGPGDPTLGKLDVFGIGAGFDRALEDFLPVHAAGTGSGFAGWYLDTTWMTPNPVQFGNITNDKQRTFTLHNTRRNVATWTAFDDASLDGFDLLTPGLPVGLAGFSDAIGTIQADREGPAAFDEFIDTTVEGVVLLLRVIGRRVVLFETFPERPISERVKFKTDNMISKDGTEQAMQIAIAPRSDVTVEIRHSRDEERTRLSNLILGAQHLLTGVQAWWQSAALTTPALSTDVVLQVNTDGMELQAEDNISVVLPDRTAHVAEVVSLTASSIEILAAVGVALPRFTSVMPIRFGFNSGSVELAAFPINAADMKATFTLIDYVNIANVDPAFFDTHPIDGLPILKRPLFFSGASRRAKLVSKMDRLDQGTGAIFVNRSEPIARPAQDVLAHCRSLADQHAWRRFLHFVRGSYGAFYVPTGENDLPLVSPGFTLGGNTFDTPNMGTANLVGTQAPRRDVQIEIAGVFHNRRVVSVVDNVATEQFTLDAVIPGVGVVPAADVRISWLTLARIAGDVATFKHLMRGVSELRFEVRGVIE